MPIKYKDTGIDLVNNIPLVDKLKETQAANSMDDMMSEIISEKIKMKSTSMLNMVGVLTPVLYYQAVADSSNNYNTDASAPSDISYDTKKYIEIKDFKIKLSNATAFDNDGEETEKSYITNGSFIVLPRTLKPAEGDIFIMNYYNKKCCYQVSSVNSISYENDSGFECQYTLYKTDYTVPENQIVEHKLYRHELVGTTYRPILTSNELERLKKYEKLHDHLSDVFNDLFYNKTIDSYIFKNYEEDKNRRSFKDNNNINTLGKNGGLFRANSTDDYITWNSQVPREVATEDQVYDNLLNIFISKNRIFRNYNGLVLSVEPKFKDDRVCYKRSIFGCIESKSVVNYKNTFILPTKINFLTPDINSYFVGKMVTNHVDHPAPCDKPNFFPETLMNQVINGKKSDMNTKCTELVYNSIESLLIETIVRYIYGKTADFGDRFNSLYDRLDDLYEHDISYASIYYLFPMMGFIIERTLEEMYSDNIPLV